MSQKKKTTAQSKRPRKAPSNQTGGTAWGKKAAAAISGKMQSADVKKLILLNFPYIIAFYMVEKAAWLYRHCNGDTIVDRLMVLFMNFGLAYKSYLPSVHPFDLLVGLIGAAALKAVIYFKGKNAKKYRQGEEYGSARWGNAKDIEPFIDPVFENNVLLTQTERLMMSGRPKHAESIRSLCLSTYLPEEVMKLNDIAEMRAGATLGKALQSEYMTVSGTCFINQSSPVMTISKNGIRFSKACHSRLDDCEYVELLYHPILQVVILRKSNHGFSTAMHWRDDNDVHSVFSARAFSGLVFQTLNWKMNYRYQCRGICRGQGNAKFLIFELDESRILTGKNQYEQENCSMNLKCRLYRSKWVQSITVNDVMESGQVVENPMIGAIPSKNEVQRELDDLLMSM